MNETVNGVLASVLTAVSLIPQLVKLIRDKKADGISMVMLITLFSGLGLWVYYGFQRNDWIIICSNGVSALLNLWIAVLTIRYK